MLKPNLIIVPNSPNLIVVSFVMVFLMHGFRGRAYILGFSSIQCNKNVGKVESNSFFPLVFTVLHIGNHAFVDCLIAFIASMLFSYTKEQTGPIYGISVTQGLTDIMLFLIMPSLNAL